MATFALLAILSLFVKSDATFCFECQNVPYPRDCAKVRVCNSDELCSTEQIVTTSGNIVYNTGCLSTSRCSTASGLIVGKRATNIAQRSSTDISTCIECCTGDFCNNQGCGTQTAPREQRGPYCFNCDTVLDPKACTEVAVCEITEQCMLYSPAEFGGLPETVYRGQCESKAECGVCNDNSNSTAGLSLALCHENCLSTKSLQPALYCCPSITAACAAMSQAFKNYRCPATCCDSDFCNNECGIMSNQSMSTPLPHTTLFPIQTQPPAVVTQDTTKVPPATVPPPTHHSTTFHCDAHNGYMLMKSAHENLCVHIVKDHANWDNARAACKSEGGDLIVLDNSEKARLLRDKVNQHDYSRERGYWIGAKDFSYKNQFSWVNGQPVTYGDWHNGQPNHHDGGHDQNCAVMYSSGEHFQWHDDFCPKGFGYICEKK